MTFFLKKAANLKIGKKPASSAKTPGRGFVGKVTKEQVREIAEKKIVDLNCDTIEVGDENDRRFGPLDGPASGGGLTDGASRQKSSESPRRRRADQALRAPDAVKLVKTNATAKFDETVELSINLGVDPEHADQMVRGVVNLPNGTGRTLRVAVFAAGPRPMKRARPARMWSEPRTSSPRCRAAKSTSTAASPLPT